MSGKSKAGMPTLKLIMLGILGGIITALTAMGSNTVIATLTNPSIAKFVSALPFPIGTMICIGMGAELFTGDTSISISLLTKEISAKQFFRILLTVYVSNFAGALMIVFALPFINHFQGLGNMVGAITIDCAQGKVNQSFLSAFIKGILCAILVVSGVIMSSHTTHLYQKLIIAGLPVFLFIICGFEQCVVNMYYIPAGIMAAQTEAYRILSASGGGLLTWSNFLWHNLIPATLGNFIGGAGIVGGSYWYCFIKNPQ